MPRSRPWLAALSMLALLFGLTAGPLLERCPRPGRADRAARLGPVHRSHRVRKRRRHLRGVHGGTTRTSPSPARSFQTEPDARDRQHGHRLRHRPRRHLLRRRPRLRRRPGRGRAAAAARRLRRAVRLEGAHRRARASRRPRSTASLRHAVADRPDRHVLQPDAARSRWGWTVPDDARRAGRLLRPRPRRRATSRSPSPTTRAGRPSTSSR